MLLSGDVVSKRGEIEPQITPLPVEITIGIAVPLVEVGRTSQYDSIKNAVVDLKIPYEIYMDNGTEVGFVYYLVSSELDIDKDELDQILPERVNIGGGFGIKPLAQYQILPGRVNIRGDFGVKPIARYVYDYLVSRGVNFVLAVCLYKVDGTWSASNVYTMLQVPFETDSDEKEFLKRDIDFVFAVYPIPQTDSDYGYFYLLLETILNHIDVCSKKEIPTLDENSLGPRIGQLERFFISGFPPNEDLISGVCGTASAYNGAFVRTVLLTSNFTEIYLPSIFGSEVEVFLSGGSNGYDFTWSLAGLPFIMTYIREGNLAKPLTGKSIGEIAFGGSKVGMSLLPKLYTLYGACLLLADNPGEAPTCYRSNTVAYGIGSYSNQRTYGIEDTEFSLMFVEDTMDKINRAFLRTFRGNILNKTMVKVIEERFKRFVLDDYLSKGWILAYRNVKFKQDDKDPTKIVGSYAYMPAYPINKIWVEHFFIL